MIINIWKNFKFRLPARWFRDEVPCGFWDCCDVRCSWASIFEDIGCSFSVGVSAHQLNVPLSSTDPSSTTLCPILIIIINYHYSNTRHVGKIIILALWSLYETKMFEFFCCKCKNKFSIHFSILIKILQILYCSAFISSKFLLFFWKKKMTVFTYIPMHSCLNACEKFQTVTSNLELRTSSCSMSENTCFVAQTGFWVADSTSVENVRLHLQKQKYHMNKVYLRVLFSSIFF